MWGISEELRESLGGEASEQITIPESMPSQGSDPSLSLSMSLEGEGTETSLTPQLETDSILSSVRSLKEGGHSQSSLSASPTKSVSSMFQNDPLTKSLSAQFYKGQSLEQEFKLLNLEGIPNLEIERVSCPVTCRYYSKSSERHLAIGRLDTGLIIKKQQPADSAKSLLASPPFPHNLVTALSSLLLTLLLSMQMLLCVYNTYDVCTVDSVSVPTAGGLSTQLHGEGRTRRTPCSFGHHLPRPLPQRRRPLLHL